MFFDTLINNIEQLFLLERPRFYFSIRFLLSCLVFCGTAVQYMQKIDISIGIVCMINNTALKVENLHGYDPLYVGLSNNSDINDTCLFKPKNDTKLN